MNGTYTLELVALSVVVAVIASYTALDLAEKVSAANAARSPYWFVGGAAAMGTGIWSMHFIGMLAFHLPIPIAFDMAITLLSMAIAILVSGFALYTIRRPELKAVNLSVSATLIGVGIAGMHYTGMLAMRMSPPIQYTPTLFVASVIIAIGASFAALWIAFQLRSKRSGLAVLARVSSAAVMGLAISGMHYTGMAAANFAPGSICLAADSTGALENDTLALIVGISTLAILIGTLIVSSLHAHFAESLSAANHQLRTVALYDGLTGLPNRTLLHDRLEKVVDRANRSGKMFALLFIDLDRFKPVNDTFGHAIGDMLLQEVAGRLSAAIRKEDTVARAGGDEFVVVLSELADKNDAALMGTKLLSELNKPFAVESHTLKISGSIGISMFPQDGSDVAVLVAKADAAMYQTKKGGRGGVTFAAIGSLPSLQ